MPLTMPVVNAEKTGIDSADAAPVKRHRLTVRSRLALTYAGLITGAGAVILVVVAILIGVVPTYEFASVASLPSATEFSQSGVTQPAPLQPGVPAQSGYGEVSPDVPPGVTERVDVGLQLAQTSAVVVSSRTDILQLLLWVSGGVLVVLAAGGALAGWYVAGRMLKPLQYVNAAAHRAARGELSHRIGFSGPRDEISELADTFDDMLGELESSFTSYRRFSANASHELRTPLATTRAMLDVAIRQAPDSQRDLLRRLRETNERSIETVESLLDLSEIESVAPRIASIELADLAEQVVDQLAEEAKAADVSIEYRLLPTVVDGDPVLIRQLMTNLVQNAIRHNRPGGELTISTRPARGTRPPTIEVVNSGVELDQDEVDVLADAFHRGSGRTTEAAAKGRGLGLSIVQAIVDRHGGSLELMARKGGGLRALVKLPQPAASAKASHEHS